MELKKIKVLVVDDSLLFREIISRGISSDVNIEVVAVAMDPYDARDKIIEFRPDVMTCDVEMPRMNGIEFIRKLLPQYSLPVIVVSSVSNAVFEAMNAGAVDFVAKPDATSVISVENFILEMIEKIKIAANASVIQSYQENQSDKIIKNTNFNPGKVIAIGASTGGTEAIYNIIKS